jgi:hypothetical protein
MSIHKRWSKYTKKNVLAEPDTYGVIEIGDIETGAILYIGEGKVRSMLVSHNPDGGRKKHVSVFGSSIVGEFGYRYELTGSREKAKHRWHNMLAAFKKEYGSLPRFNQRQEKGEEKILS